MTELLDGPVVPQSIAPRALVPTERQLAEGLPKQVVDVDAPAVPEAVETGPGRRERFRGYVRSLDPRAIQGPRLPLIVFALLALFVTVDDAIFSVILPELRAEFGGDIGPLIAVNLAVAFGVQLSAPFFGFMVDRVNRVRMVQVSQIGSNLVGLCTPFMGHSLVSVTMYRGATGMVGGAQASAPNSLISDYYDTENATKVITLLPAIGALGGIISPTVAGRCVDAFGGWRPAAVVLGVFATVVSLATLLLREPKRGTSTVQALGAEIVNQRTPTFTESIRAVKGVYTIRRIWYAWIFCSAAQFGLSNFLPLYWAQVFGLTPSQRGYLVSVGFAAQFGLLFGLQPVLARIAFRKPGRLMLVFGTVVMSLALFTLVIAWSSNLPLSIAMSLPLTAGIAALTPAIVVLMIRLLPADVRGFGLTSIAPFQLVGMLVFLIAQQTVPNTAGGLRGLALTFMPFFLIGGYLLATASHAVDKDIRAAEAATLAHFASIGDETNRGAFLVCRDIEVQYHGTTVLDGLNLDVAEGEMLALLGTNGAGKSTLLKVICGVVPASNGAIYLDGRNITREPPHLNVRHGVVMVPGGRAVFPTLSVRENLRSASLVTTDAGEPTMDMEEVFALFPVLRERLDQRAGDLSGGEQQMVALGQALLMRPKLMMIDELSLGLAPAVVDQLLDALTQINEQGTTIVIVEQSVNVALTVARRAIFMDQGAIVFDGATDELLSRPDLVRSVFMGGATGGAFASPRRRVDAATDAVEALRVEGLTVDFGGIRALDDISLSVVPQEILGILGPNGAGKTTLFDCISGFVPMTHGQVLIEGVDVGAESPDARARLGLARSFQDARLFPSMTVRENIAVALERLASRNTAAALVWSPATRRSEERIHRRVDGLIDLLNLGDLADKFVAELSTGSRRAVDVALVMAAEPKVLLLDEPSSGLAQAEVEALGPVITRLARETGAAVVVIEHDLALLSSVSQRLAAMERGHLVTVGTPQEVLADPRVISSYLNASERALARSGSRMSSIAAALGADASAQSQQRPTEGSTS